MVADGAPVNPLEAPLGGIEEAAHLIRRARLQDKPRQAWAAAAAIDKLEEVLVLLRDVAGEEPATG
jgi:hypothetical protein